MSLPFSLLTFSRHYQVHFLVLINGGLHLNSQPGTQPTLGEPSPPGDEIRHQDQVQLQHPTRICVQIMSSLIFLKGLVPILHHGLVRQ